MRLHLKEGAVAPQDRYGNSYPNAVIDFIDVCIVRKKYLRLNLGLFKDDVSADALLAPIDSVELIFGVNPQDVILDSHGNVKNPPNGGANSVIFALDFNFEEIDITHESAKTFILAHKDVFAPIIMEQTEIGDVPKHFSLGDNYEIR